MKRKALTAFGIAFVSSIVMSACSLSIPAGLSLPERPDLTINNTINLGTMSSVDDEPTVPKTEQVVKEQVTIYRHVSGNSFEVVLACGLIERVVLTGVETQNWGEDGFEEAADFIASLLPIGSSIYLEQHGVNRNNLAMLNRYAWLSRHDDPDAMRRHSINHRLIAEGHGRRTETP